jgi:hypothetical protein
LAAEEESPAGAEAFVHHWFDLVNYGYRTGQIATLRAASSGDCATCQNTLQTIEDQYADGGRFFGGQIYLGTIVVSGRDSTGAFGVAASLDQEPLRRVNSDGSPGEISDGERGLVLNLRVAKADSKWQMMAIAPGGA